ncbi:alpha/beta fold hydrolase [Flavobacteriaceae bacterium AU392]|nr:S9 family peptidase [Flavobacteriaceae bacterium]RKM84796.1 alpha/beta fold hydrolase [Flavobacteriaceae bacterium AU392]
MKLDYILFYVLFFTITLYSQEANIISKGIADSIYNIEYPKINTYRSKINFPPFIGWNQNGKKMLFNGGKVIYSMKKYNSEIKEYKEFDNNLSSYLSPNHNYFLYQEDENGNEDYQLFLYDITTNKGKVLSEEGDKSYDSFWSPDSQRFIFKSNKRNPAEVDLYVRGVSDSHDEQLLFSNISDDGQVYDWSLEKNTILAVKVISENNKFLYSINDQSGEIEQINPNKNNIAYSDAKFIPNQNACLIISDEFSEFLQLQLYDLSSKKFKVITSNIPWDIEALTIDKNGKKAAFSINKNGLSQLYILDLKTLKYSKVNDSPEGIIRNLIINSKGTEVGFNLYASTFYRKVFGYNIKINKLNQYTRKGKLLIDTLIFAKAESFTYKSIDPDNKIEYNIPAFIYRPNIESPSPVFIDIHGGPEYQIKASFNSFYQYLVNELGITVILPNIRGSNGYGKSYMKLDDGINRENAIEDVGALLDWIKKQPDLDADRVAIYGESYGGYVTLASLAKYSKRIKCGIDVVGISNWITYLKSTRDYRRDLRRVEFGDERNNNTSVFLKEISPINNVDKIDSPLLIFQGLNDPRVNYKESEQVYKALNSLGKEVWYVLAKDEGHGFKKNSNYLLQRNLTISFLKKHLIY